MTQVLNKVREVDPNDSEAVKEVVNTFFQNLTKIADSDTTKWLRTLGEVINRFPKYCMSHRNTTENVISTSIDSNDYYYVIEAAKCAQALQQVRPSQEKTATPKTSWQNQMDLLCNAAYSLITALFPNAVDIYKNNVTDQESSSDSVLTTALLEITSITKNHGKSDKKMLLQTRLRNILCFIQAMLVEIYPVAKPIRPQTILDVIVRALSASSGSKDGGVDVASIKIETLRTLDALIACLGPNLIPFSPLLFRLLMQTLRWTSENPDKDISKVRLAAYGGLERWLTTLRAHRPPAHTRRCWEDELAQHVHRDIAPRENTVELTMGPQPTKNMSKKAKRKLANARLLGSTIAGHMPGEKNKISKPEESNDEVSLAALECAETYLLVCGRFLKPSTHKMLQERVIRACYDAHRHSEGRVLRLLRVAEAARRSAPAGVPPPTQHCLQLYSTLASARGEISKFCTQALLDIRLHLHCSPPSLNFALEAPQEAPQNKRKKMSNKNRAALESLLGSDRVAALNSHEDVITIPDEPASKKPRLDDEVDKISVSSDSISSVEISDDSDIEEVTLHEQSDAEDSSRNMERDPESTNVTNQSDSIPVENETIVAMDEDTANPNNLEESKNTTVQSESNMQTEISLEGDKCTDVATATEKVSIHEAPTQMPLNISNDTIDGDEGPLSLEVGYDYPSTGNGKINVLNKVEDENLPSTNETDDIITCGQAVRSSPEIYLEKKSDDADMIDVDANLVEVEVPKLNGNVSENEIVENGKDNSVDNAKGGDTEAIKMVSKDEGVSIEDMMADFVDEVNEDVNVS